MALTQEERIEDGAKLPRPKKISVLLLTQNLSESMQHSPKIVMSYMPKEISKEILVVHYSYSRSITPMEVESESDRSNDQNPDERITHIQVKGEFAYGVMKGLELSTGNYILVINADLPYSRQIIPELIQTLMLNPNSIIVASRYVKDASIRRIPFMQNIIGKAGRIITRYGLNIKNIKDPTSGCFAFSRQTIKDISLEGRGNEPLLEILVKLNEHNADDKITVKEIPIKQDDVEITRKLDMNRIINYSKDVWKLYRYGKKSMLESNKRIGEQKMRTSVLFLSKAGRFLTVGASGLAVNYIASFLISNLVPNIWYIHATLFGIILSITSNFLLNKVWTFEDRDFSTRHFLRQYLSFMSLCALGALIQLSAVYAFVENFHVPYAASLIVAVCFASLSNFLLNKKITFGEKIWE